MPVGDIFTDLALERGTDGIYDLVIDEANADLATVSGFETAIMCSLFSDRRAAADEVADPMKRRGWIGNLVADVPGDNFGNGYWLYEQSRGDQETRNGIHRETIEGLDWMLQENLAKSIDATLDFEPRRRRLTVSVAVVDSLGRQSRRSYEIWKATGSGRLATNVG